MPLQTRDGDMVLGQGSVNDGLPYDNEARYADSNTTSLAPVCTTRSRTNCSKSRVRTNSCTMRSMGPWWYSNVPYFNIRTNSSTLIKCIFALFGTTDSVVGTLAT